MELYRVSYLIFGVIPCVLPNFIFGAYLCLSSESDMFHTPGGRKGLTWCRQYAPFYVGSYIYEDSILSLCFTQSRRRSFCPTPDLPNIPLGLRMANDQTIILWMLDSRKLYTDPWSNRDRLRRYILVCYHNLSNILKFQYQALKENRSCYTSLTTPIRTGDFFFTLGPTCATKGKQGIWDTDHILWQNK